MLVTFKSKAAAEVLMYQEHARRILDLLHKDIDRGVITADEAGAAVAAIETEIADSRAHSASENMQRDIAAHPGEPGEDHEHEHPEPVSFATRAYPLLEMLRAAQQGHHDVLWGV